MVEALYRGRKAIQIENNLIRVTVTVEGCHIAAILLKAADVNPLWSPQWPSIEPSAYDPEQHSEYGAGNEAHLLSGILGHNICLDVFGAPGPQEARAGIPVHGEAGLSRYQVLGQATGVEFVTVLERAQIRFSRQITLRPDSAQVEITELVENLASFDRPIAWTQHVTLGAPYLKAGETQFRMSATHSKVIGAAFNDGQGMQQPDAEFEWPLCPRRDGTQQDLRVFPSDEHSGEYTAHLMDPVQSEAWFCAWSPETKVLFGYRWARADFPWLARWEENHLRTEKPWNGAGLACGMEFGVSPMVESRQEMVERGRLFGTPTFRWLPAKAILNAKYSAFILTAASIPETTAELTSAIFR